MKHKKTKEKIIKTLVSKFGIGDDYKILEKNLHSYMSQYVRNNLTNAINPMDIPEIGSMFEYNEFFLQ